MARQRVSERTFIDAAGAEVDRMEQATGARYTLVKETGKDDKGNPVYGAEHQFDLQLGEAGKPATMYAIFGVWTKLGNEANSVLNDKENPGTIDDAADAIQEFITSVDGGVWREAGAGGTRGPKYDNEVLAVALHATLGAAAKGDAESYKARLLADKSYRAKVVSNDKVKAQYWAEMAKRGVEKPQASADALA
jgi:hypothetical protein